MLSTKVTTHGRLGKPNVEIKGAALMINNSCKEVFKSSQNDKEMKYNFLELGIGKTENDSTLSTML